MARAECHRDKEMERERAGLEVWFKFTACGFAEH